jgi:hypothetical protein
MCFAIVVLKTVTNMHLQRLGRCAPLQGNKRQTKVEGSAQRQKPSKPSVLLEGSPKTVSVTACVARRIQTDMEPLQDRAFPGTLGRRRAFLRLRRLLGVQILLLHRQTSFFAFLSTSHH